MLAAVLILILAFYTVFFAPNWNERNEEDLNETRKTPQIKKLWGLAQSAMRERKPMKAEKALLTILKFDEKNAAAYNRLGILYAKEKHFKEAVECFEIAQSLDNNASSLHNVGLIYFETGKYEKAAMAFSQAIEIEGDQPGRYIAYAKALEKLGNRSKAIEALETAYSLNPSTVVLRHILEIYENAGDTESAEHVRERIEQLQLEKAEAEAKSAKTQKRTRRIVKAGTKVTAEETKKAAKRKIIIKKSAAKELPKKRKII
ncbi:MAG: tetratricopeptide repeat protein [Candidatus Saccharibacteria bacterium]|nr:tetratricopeptide repeat protein [Candidatus Saccharibacteria bacterium]